MFQEKGLYILMLCLMHALVVKLTHECCSLCPDDSRYETTYRCSVLSKSNVKQCKPMPTRKGYSNSEVSDLINDLDRNGKASNATALECLIDKVATWTESLQKEMAEEKDPQQRKKMVDALMNVLLTLAKNIFVTDKISPFKNYDPEKKNKLASKVFDNFEANGPPVAAALPRGTTSRRKNKNNEILLRNIDLTLSQMSASFLFNSDGFSLDMGSLREVSDADTLGIASSLFSGAGVFLTPDESASLTYQRVNTLVMTISVNTKTPVVFLSKNVTITMKLQALGLSSPVCYSMQPKTAELTPTGCTAQSINATHATCSCNHLTSFVILMSVSKSAEDSSLALDIVSYVSCSFSVLFLLLSFITFVSFAALKSDLNTIHTNLVACLGLGQLLFLVGVDRTQDKMACAVIAGALHYLFLASFCWMGVEGVQIYLKLVLVFETSRSLLPVYFSVGYGVPVIIVAVATGLFPQGYGTEASCWLSKERGFHWSFVGPVLGVVAFNTVMLLVGLVVMWYYFKSPTDQEICIKAKACRLTRGLAMLLCITGIPWILGTVGLSGTSTAVFAYIFDLLNGAQGAFIFIFHCLTYNKVRNEYRRALGNADWIPGCCRQCLLLLLGAPSQRQVAHLTGTGTASVKMSPSFTSKPTKASSPSKVVEMWCCISSNTVTGEGKAEERAGEGVSL